MQFKKLHYKQSLSIIFILYAFLSVAILNHETENGELLLTIAVTQLPLFFYILLILLGSSLGSATGLGEGPMSISNTATLSACWTLWFTSTPFIIGGTRLFIDELTIDLSALVVLYLSLLCIYFFWLSIFFISVELILPLRLIPLGIFILYFFIHETVMAEIKPFIPIEASFRLIKIDDPIQQRLYSAVCILIYSLVLWSVYAYFKRNARKAELS